MRSKAMERKYEFTGETKRLWNITLYRIKALRDFGNVKAGNKGGWIESEENLSHEDTCWVYENAEVFDSARVIGSAQVFDTARVFDTAQVYGRARVYGDARVYKNSAVHEDAQVYGYAQVYGGGQIGENAQAYGYAQIGENAHVYGSAQLCGDARVYGSAEVCGNAIVSSDRDYIVFKNWWSSGRYFTWTRSNNKWKVGCFYGTGEELIRKAYEDSERSGREYECIVRYVNSVRSEE